MTYKYAYMHESEAKKLADDLEEYLDNNLYECLDHLIEGVNEILKEYPLRSVWYGDFCYTDQELGAREFIDYIREEIEKLREIEGYAIVGNFDTYANEVADEIMEVPEHLQRYFDYVAFAEDYRMDFAETEILRESVYIQ